MADDWQKYVNDSRPVCKYGAKCYQKNPDHHNTFKHPPLLKKNNANPTTKRYSPYTNRTTGKQSPDISTDSIDDKTIPIEPSQTKVEKKIEDTEIEKKNHDHNVCIPIPKDLKYFDRTTDRSIFKDTFLVEMPDDFFKFYEFVSSIDKSAEELLKSVNLELIGPYDLLLGKLPILENNDLYLIHWRFFYDPPEFQAVLKKTNSEYHIGYYRDTPDDKTPFLASNDSAKGYTITIMSDNIFGAVYLFLQNEKKNSPFTAMSCQKLMNKIKTYAEENNISLEEFNMKKRVSQIVTKTFHGAGIVVPYNKKTQVGYRRLAETDAHLKKLFANLQKATSTEEKDKCFTDLQVVVTNASIAVDEGDFGTGLELAIALFCSGLKELQAMALSNFTSAYNVLSRTPFARIAEFQGTINLLLTMPSHSKAYIRTHLKYRRTGSNMSLLS